MFRAVMSVVVLAAFMAGQPGRAAAQSTAGRASARPAASGPININTAAAADLEGLPGIGAKTAARIIEYRQKNGPFKKVEDLMNVRGIGEKNFLKLKSQLTVGAPRTDQDPHQHHDR